MKKTMTIGLIALLSIQALSAYSLYYVKGNDVKATFSNMETLHKGYLIGENQKHQVVVLYNKFKPNVIIKDSKQKLIYIQDKAHLIDVYNNIVVEKHKIYPKDNNSFDGLGCIYSPYSATKQYKCFYNIKSYSGQLIVENHKIKKICEKHTQTCLVSSKKDIKDFIKKIVITKKDK